VAAAEVAVAGGARKLQAVTSRTAVVVAWVVHPPRSRTLKAARAELSAIAQDWLWTRLEIIEEQDRRRLPVELRRLVVHLPLRDLSCRPQPALRLLELLPCASDHEQEVSRSAGGGLQPDAV
jgi:hypothetical protein